MTNALLDLIVTARGLARARGFTLLALTMLFMGLTANTVIFSILHAVAHPELPYASPDRIVSVTEAYAPYGWVDTPLSLATVMDLRQARLFSDVAAHTQRRVSYADGEHAPVRLRAAIVTANTWRAVGVSPVMGRSFDDGDDRSGRVHGVTIGYRLWRDRYGLAPDILNRSVTVDGIARPVIAVMPEGFLFPEAEDLWLPLGTVLDTTPGALDDREGRAWRTVVRLVDGQSVESANGALRAVSARLATEYPSSQSQWRLSAVPVTREALAATGTFFGAMQAGALLLVLLLCANLGNLWLARGEARKRELAIRSALGASPSRLRALLLLEPILLCLAATAAALVVSAWVVTSIPLLIPEFIPFFIRFRIDGGVIMFSAATGLVSAVLTGAASAFRPPATLAGTLAGTASTLSGTLRAGRTRAGFLFAQTALAAGLLTSTFVVAGGLRHAARVDLGFDPANRLELELPLPPDRARDPDELQRFVRDLVERLGAHPGVDAVAIASPIALEAPHRGHATVAVDRDVQDLSRDAAPTISLAVTADYFKAEGVQLVRGRAFSAGDRSGAEPVVILNAEAARRFFGAADVIGRRIAFGRSGETRRWRSVVGVAADTVQHPLDPEVEPRLYVPFAQDSGSHLNVTIRSRHAPNRLAREISSAVHALDPSLAFEAPITGQRRLDMALWPLRFFSGFAACLAVMGLLVASAGVYGLARYLTLAGTRDIAIRLALGAHPRAIATLLMVKTGMPLVAGLLTGLTVSVPVAAALPHVVAGVPAFDAAPVIAAAVVLGAVAAAAITLPARRAMRIEPSEALRS